MGMAYGYCRASTAGQQYTLEAQRLAIERHFENHLKDAGLEWGGFFEDRATSGGKPLAQREKGGELWALVEPGDCIVWSKLDRAFRNVADAATVLKQLEERGVALCSLDVQLDTSTPLGRFVLHLLSLLGELEREWIRQRTREALAIRQSKGLPHGGRPPAGWKKMPSGEWVPDLSERRLIDWLVMAHDTRGWTYTEIVQHLKRKGILRANGDRYHQPWLHYALKARAAGYPGRDGWRNQCQVSRKASLTGEKANN